MRLKKDGDKNSWNKIHLIRCDMCERIAKWKHSDGGYRCHKCPRRNIKLSELDIMQLPLKKNIIITGERN